MEDCNNVPETKKVSFPKALGFALCFTIVYLAGVWLLDIPYGLAAIAYYIYFPPFVFMGGIVLYYIYNFFRELKKLIWFYLGLAFIIIVSLYNSGFGEIDVKLKNMLHFSQLPKEYENYKDIDSDTVFYFGKKMMTLKFTSDNVIQTYLNPNNELIVITEQTQEDSQPDVHKSIVTTFKLDKDGNIIDQFQYAWDQDRYNNREVLFEGYLINTEQNYYHTWALDGDTISIINENLEWDKLQQTIQYKAIASKLKFFTQYSLHSADGTKLVFLQDDKCGVFNFNFFPEDGEIQSRGNSNNNVFRKYSVEEYGWIPIKAKNIQYLYFHRDKLERSWHNIGGNTPSHSTDNWKGGLYSNVTVGTDTLKIKEQLWLDPEWKTTDIEIEGKRIGALSRFGMPVTPYLYYAHPNLDFQLLTNMESRLFVIQNKSQ
jgi:hypothetical protein